MSEKQQHGTEATERRQQKEADRKRRKAERPYDFTRSWGLEPDQVDDTYRASHFIKGIGWVSDEGPDGGPPGPIPQAVADRIREILRDEYVTNPGSRAAVNAEVARLRAENQSTTSEEKS
jgi:hypothetical protein